MESLCSQLAAANCAREAAEAEVKVLRSVLEIRCSGGQGCKRELGWMYGSWFEITFYLVGSG